MSKEKVLPLKIIQGMEWYLGLPDDFLHYTENNLDRSFQFVTMEDGLEGLAVDSGEKVLSVVQRNAMKNGCILEAQWRLLSFRVSLPRKLPYVSPYEDSSHLQPDSDECEKRVVGLLHELLSLFVEHSAERKKLFCLKKYMGLPQKVHRACERHPEIFYLSHKNKTCTAILKEAYCDESAIEKHPLLAVRKKYIRLMRESAVILKNRRVNGRLAGGGNMELDLDLEHKHEGRGGGENTKVDLDLESENVDNRDGECSQYQVGAEGLFWNVILYKYVDQDAVYWGPLSALGLQSFVNSFHSTVSQYGQDSNQVESVRVRIGLLAYRYNGSGVERHKDAVNDFGS
ncbi:hypothetical protein ACLB2K_068871 [Fragaria x ananassa]